MGCFKLSMFLLGTFLFRGIDPVIASSQSRSDSPSSINLTQPNLEVVLTEQKEQWKARFNLENLYANRSNPFAQVNSVSQLADVHSTDWTFQAFQSLSERYGCLVKSFYTRERVSRQEFALNLNVCLNHISKLVTSSKADLLTKEDLSTLERLQADFAAELAIFGNHIDLANRSSNDPGREQFSTTTKLNAEAIFSFIGSNDPNFKGQSRNLEDNKSDLNQSAFGYRTTLNAARGSGNEAADPSPGRGLFNSSFSTGINTFFELTDNWRLGATYLYSYSARDRVFLFNSKVNIAGWVGWTKALDSSSDNEADIMNWAVTVVFLDALKEGNKAGLVVGMPPKLASIKNGNSDPNNALQVEAFYTHKVNDNIFLNPGFYVIVNPENDSRNDTIFVGLLRTNFEF